MSNALAFAIDSSIDIGRLPEIGNRAGVNAICRRYLNWLGYLKKDNNSDVLDVSLQRALTAFQTDLTELPSGNPTPYTVKALNQLVAFESNDVARPMVGELDLDNRALLRARRLRMSVYGFTKRNANPNSEAFKKALKKFEQIIVALKVPEAHLNMGERKLDQFLFNLDSVSRHIKGTKRNISLSIPHGLNSFRKKRFLQGVGDFCRQIAGIELWLLGYDVNLNELQSSDLNLIRSLKHFWLDMPKEKRPNLQARKNITGHLFRCINSTQQEVSESEASEAQKGILKKFDEKVFREQVEKQAGSFLGRLWDGIKRATRWLFNLFRRAGRKVVQLVKNAARWLVTGAQDFFADFSALLSAMKIGFNFLFKDNSIDGDINSVFIDRKADFDFNVFINDNGNNESQLFIVSRYHQASVLFKYGTRGFVILWKIFKTVISKIGSAPWFFLFWALVKTRELINDIRLLIENCKKELKIWNEMTKTAGSLSS